MSRAIRGRQFLESEINRADDELMELVIYRQPKERTFFTKSKTQKRRFLKEIYHNLGIR